MHLRYIIALLALSALSACSISVFTDQRVTVEKEYSINAPGTVTVKVIASNGHIYIQEHDQDTIDVQASISLSAKTKSDLDLASDSVQVRSLIDGVLEISVAKPDRASSASCAFDLQIPTGMKLDLLTSNGRIEVDGDYPEVIVYTSNGRITLTGNIPIFDLRSSNGRIEINQEGDWSGTGKVHSSNGKISMHAKGLIEATLTSKTSNGSVNTNIANGAGTLNLTTSNGSIRVTHHQ